MKDIIVADKGYIQVSVFNNNGRIQAEIRGAKVVLERISPIWHSVNPMTTFINNDTWRYLTIKTPITAYIIISKTSFKDDVFHTCFGANKDPIAKAVISGNIISGLLRS